VNEELNENKNEDSKNSLYPRSFHSEDILDTFLQIVVIVFGSEDLTISETFPVAECTCAAETFII
jgi:hypothetical protein